MQFLSLLPAGYSLEVIYTPWALVFSSLWCDKKKKPTPSSQVLHVRRWGVIFEFLAQCMALILLSLICTPSPSAWRSTGLEKQELFVYRNLAAAQLSCSLFWLSLSLCSSSFSSSCSWTPVPIPQGLLSSNVEWWHHLWPLHHLHKWWQEPSTGSLLRYDLWWRWMDRKYHSRFQSS